MSPHKLALAESAKQGRRVGAPAHSVCWGEGGPLEMAPLLQVRHCAQHTACRLSAAADASKAFVHTCCCSKSTLSRVSQPAGQSG